MSHHGKSPFDEGENPLLRKLMKQIGQVENPLKAAQAKLQGEFPEGRLNVSDEGAIAVMVGHEKGKVVMQFPSPTVWIGFNPEQAIDIAQALITHARQAGFVGAYTLKFG